MAPSVDLDPLGQRRATAAVSADLEDTDQLVRASASFAADPRHAGIEDRAPVPSTCHESSIDDHDPLPRYFQLALRYAGWVSGDGLSIERDCHPGGEYTFTPGALTLSLTLGSSLTLEQTSDGRRWVGRSSRGAVNVMPAGVTRVFRHRDSCKFARVTIPGALDGEVRPRFVLRDDPLRLLLEAAVRGAATRLFRDDLAQTIVGRLRALDHRSIATPAHGLPPFVFSRVLEYLEAHLGDDLSVEDLATVADLSPAHFSILFRNSFGEPPHRYVLRLRVERARRLLEGGANPSTAAFTVGFYDQSHLARHMRRLLGITPGVIARASSGSRSKDRPIRRG